MREGEATHGESAGAASGARGSSAAQEAAMRYGVGHATPAEYVKIAVALALVTIIEVAVFYAKQLGDILIPILVVLSALKFAMVALWYMHLKFDSRLFSWLFVFGIILAAAVFIAAWSTLDILL